MDEEAGVVRSSAVAIWPLANPLRCRPYVRL
jgi:hypothetical protein